MVDLTDIGCCSCFSFLKKPNVSVRQPPDADGMLSKDLLKHELTEDPDGSFFTGDDLDESFYNLDESIYSGDDHGRSFYYGDDSDRRSNSEDDPDRIFYDRDNNDCHDGSDEGPPRKTYEDIINSRIQNGFSCREIPVKETKMAFRSEDETGNKMINEYVHLGEIGCGSYGKVVRYRSLKDGNLYAVKVLNKCHMKKIHVVRLETAMTDVFREVAIMKMVDHPNIVTLVEVIDDPNKDKLYMVLEYVEGKMVCDNGLNEDTARNFLRDMISALMYLHSHSCEAVRNSSLTGFLSPVLLRKLEVDKLLGFGVVIQWFRQVIIEQARAPLSASLLDLNASRSIVGGGGYGFSSCLMPNFIC